MADDIHPILPPEIEEIIFSLAAEEDVKTSSSLIFVAKRVHEWLKPLLYKVAILHGDESLCERPRFNPCLLRAQGQYVRHIVFWDALSDDSCLNNPAMCLEWCPNMVDIALWRGCTIYDEPFIDQLLRLPLTHLSFDITWFHRELEKHSISKRISFTSVTHLHLIGLTITLQADEIQAFFPSVTHLALNQSRKLSSQKILCAFGRRLKLLVWIVGKHGSIRSRTPIPDDPRIAVVIHSEDYVEDWNEVVKDGPRSMWRVAEAEIRGRPWPAIV